MENYTFYPGQKVVCVDRYSPFGNTDLSVGYIYTIRSVSLGHCGYLVLDVGHRCDGASTLCQCGSLYGEGSGIIWKRASRFRPLDTLTNQVERIEKEGAPLELETA